MIIPEFILQNIIVIIISWARQAAVYTAVIVDDLAMQGATLNNKVDYGPIPNTPVFEWLNISAEFLSNPF